MIGADSVAGSFSVPGAENWRLVDDRPCKVKGRSLSKVGSDGSWTARL